MVTIRDVAKEAGVSTATVSRVLNNHRRVDTALVERVQAAVDTLGYRIHPIGRALRTQQTAMWAFIASDIENPFFASVLRGLEDVALDSGRLVMMCNTNEDLVREQQYLRTAVEHRLSGVAIATASSEASDLGLLVKNRIPVILVDRVSDAYPEIDSVLVDSYSGARCAVNHLLSRGYGRVACISGPQHVSTAAQRQAGYEAAITEARRPRSEILVEPGDYRSAGGYDAATRLLSMPNRPDALFVSNGQMASGAFAAAHEMGIRIPDELGFATFDDEPWMSLVSPQLTAVRQPTQELGAVAAELLIQRAEHTPNPSVDRHTILAPKLIARDSTRGPSG